MGFGEASHRRRQRCSRACVMMKPKIESSLLPRLRYGRTLAANDSLALQYTIDAVPVALATGTIVSRTTSISGVKHFNARPLTAQASRRSACNSISRMAQRFIRSFTLTAAFSTSINRCLSKTRASSSLSARLGGGVRIFTSERRAVNIGVKFHHISNGDRAGSNRGLNHFVIYAGFSIFR